jgi:cytochrome c peroxidase
LASEQAEAIAHVSRIIREDDGTGELAQEFGGLSYSVLLTGTDPTIPEEFLLPEDFRVDVSQATDQEIFHAVSRLIGVYTENLVFSQDEEGNFNLSPYDVFLELNNLPRQPRKWESDLSYSKRLLKTIERLESSGHLYFPMGHFGKHKKLRKSPSNPSIQFVERNPNTEDGKFQFLEQAFIFGEEELKGLKIFFAQKRHRLRPSDLAQGGIGNCIACHAAPKFTDFRFHNTGISQFEYDRIHGEGAFSGLDIPGLIARNLNPDAFLPATPQHPNAQEPFRAIPMANNSQLADLGVWNIFWNPDFLSPQLSIWQILCEDALKGQLGFFHILRSCQPDRLLPKAIAVFKTPGLRDLGHSAPYTHSGINDTLEGVIRGYMRNSNLARQSELRNGAPELKNIALLESDFLPLVAFLNALNEDYE